MVGGGRSIFSKSIQMHNLLKLIGRSKLVCWSMRHVDTGSYVVEAGVACKKGFPALVVGGRLVL